MEEMEDMVELQPQDLEDARAQELSGIRDKIQAEIDQNDHSLFTLTKLKHVLCDYQERNAKLVAEAKQNIDAIAAEEEAQRVSKDLVD